MTVEEMFWLIHEGLPREAPGSADTTRLLARLAAPLPPSPRVVDIGCGTGPATMVLAREFGATVTAVDTHAPFLARLRAEAAAAGLTDRIQTLEAPMQELPLADGCADLVWAEGSAYLMGFEAALASWRRLLAPGGVLVLTEAEWTTVNPAAGARAFWDEGYPAMRTTDGNSRAALDAGWIVAATYLLPDSDWATYYEPLAARVEQLRTDPTIDPAVIDAETRELDLRRDHGGDYGYTAYVLRPR